MSDKKSRPRNVRQRIGLAATRLAFEVSVAFTIGRMRVGTQGTGGPVWRSTAELPWPNWSRGRDSNPRPPRQQRSNRTLHHWAARIHSAAAANARHGSPPPPRPAPISRAAPGGGDERTGDRKPASASGPGRGGGRATGSRTRKQATPKREGPSAALAGEGPFVRLMGCRSLEHRPSAVPGGHIRVGEAGGATGATTPPSGDLHFGDGKHFVSSRCLVGRAHGLAFGAAVCRIASRLSTGNV